MYVIQSGAGVPRLHCSGVRAALQFRSHSRFWINVFQIIIFVYCAEKKIKIDRLLKWATLFIDLVICSHLQLELSRSR